MGLPDLLAVAPFYLDWTEIGGGVSNYLAYGDLPTNGFADVKSYLRYSLLMGFTSPDKIAGTLAWYSGPSMDTGAIDAVYAALQTTTPKDLQTFVKAHFGANQRAVVELRTDVSPSASPATAGSFK